MVNGGCGMTDDNNCYLLRILISSIIHRPSSIIHHPSSIIHNPSSTQDGSYVTAAITLASSILSSSHISHHNHPLICLVLPSVSEASRSRLSFSGWLVKVVQSIPVPRQHGGDQILVTRWKDLYTKLRVWELIELVDDG